jgi:hypothetical protein
LATIVGVNGPKPAVSGSPPASPQQQKKKILIEALLLALRNSEVARIVDIGTLEYFLDSSYKDMVRGDSVDLSLLWNVLIKEPGIDASMVFPPLLAYKSWEGRLQVQVTLPEPLLALSPEDQKNHEARCPIRLIDLDQHLIAQKITVPKVTTAATPRRARKVTPAPVTPRRKRTVLLLVALGVLAAIVGGGVWWALTPRRPAAFDVAALEGQLHLRDGRRSGQGLSAVLADSEFDQLPPPERERRIRAIFDRAQPFGIHTFLLFDATGRLRGTVHDNGNGEVRAQVLP